MSEPNEPLSDRQMIELLSKVMLQFDKGLITREELNNKLFQIAYHALDPTATIDI